MSITGIKAGLSGVLAAQNRFESSSNNIANVRSVSGPNPAVGETVSVRDAQGNTVFRPTVAQDTTTTTGAVRSTQTLANPSAVQLFDPSAPDAAADGTVFRGNVDLGREVTEQIRATAQFEANVQAIRIQDEALEESINILS